MMILLIYYVTNKNNGNNSESSMPINKNFNCIKHALIITLNYFIVDTYVKCKHRYGWEIIPLNEYVINNYFIHTYANL